MLRRVVSAQSLMTAEDWQLDSSFSLQEGSVPTSVCWRPSRSDTRKPPLMLLVGSASQAEASHISSSLPTTTINATAWSGVCAGSSWLPVGVSVATHAILQDIYQSEAPDPISIWAIV